MKKQTWSGNTDFKKLIIRVGISSELFLLGGRREAHKSLEAHKTQKEVTETYKKFQMQGDHSWRLHSDKQL